MKLSPRRTFNFYFYISFLLVPHLSFPDILFYGGLVSTPSQRSTAITHKGIEGSKKCDLEEASRLT